MAKHPFDRDRFNNVDLHKVRIAGMSVIDAVQDFTPEQQMAAMAAVNIMLAKHLAIPLHDVLDATNRMMRVAEGISPEFAAIREYMKGELE